MAVKVADWPASKATEIGKTVTEGATLTNTLAVLDSKVKKSALSVAFT